MSSTQVLVLGKNLYLKVFVLGGGGGEGAGCTVAASSSRLLLMRMFFSQKTQNTVEV